MILTDKNTGEPPGTPVGDESEHTRETVSHLARASRTLHAAALRGAEIIEVTAIDSRSGALRDSMWTRHPKEVKKFVRSNREAFFELRVAAGQATARRVLAALGAPDVCDSMHSRARLYLLYRFASTAKRVAIVAPQEGTYAWRPVSLIFPRDPSGRATIRGAVVILTVRTAVTNSPDPTSPLGSASQSSLPL
jgi:hypothetical protein